MQLSGFLQRLFMIRQWIVAVFSVIVAVTFSVPAGVFAESTLQFDDVIQMLDHSDKQFNYVGTKFVVDYTPTRRSTTLVKVAHDATSGVQKQEMASLQDGKSQIIIDDGKFLWHYIPSQASVVKKKRRLSLGELSKRIRYQKDRIQDNYFITITTDPTEHDSGATQMPSVQGDVIISFQPKAHDRPGWKVWIESEHGLVVRTEIYDISGNLAMLSAFSELTFKPKLPEEAFTMTVPKGTTVTTSLEETFQSIEDAQQIVSFSILEPAYLPSGFLLSSVIVSSAEERERVQLTYIDGMSSISMFEDKRLAPTSEASKASKEVTINNTVKGTFYDHGLLKILNWQQSNHVYVTLVGEVADTELLKMASSITTE
jgi:outer membrane lipoprotein-sorting protein